MTALVLAAGYVLGLYLILKACRSGDSFEAPLLLAAGVAVHVAVGVLIW